ncbi:MAG: hypothetical protein Harvfovirus5_36 [Harvfovirus sp.]|uniref:Glycine-rich domain-containing protein-like n=1 Tax=Harvfovirus sp. TaxID=2487768 RepID=A0A3G5A0N6_9VIRU|nr:MAG: hypothetical protein Harvfovirus5_36 [Harvfovirus sp.]
MLKQAHTLFFDDIMKQVQKKIPSTVPIDLLKKEYLRFFVLAFSSLNKFPCRPSPLIDIVWHEHILSTRQYDSDCKLVGSEFLHHTPESKPETVEKQEEFHKDAIFMFEQYKLLFGEDPPATIWFPTTTVLDDPCVTCG